VRAQLPRSSTDTNVLLTFRALTRNCSLKPQRTNAGCAPASSTKRALHQRTIFQRANFARRSSWSLMCWSLCVGRNAGVTLEPVPTQIKRRQRRPPRQETREKEHGPVSIVQLTTERSSVMRLSNVKRLSLPVVSAHVVHMTHGWMEGELGNTAARKRVSKHHPAVLSATSTCARLHPATTGLAELGYALPTSNLWRPTNYC
jgi:hypothetical protein